MVSPGKNKLLSNPSLREKNTHVESIMSSPDPAIASPETSGTEGPVRFGFENTYARLPEHFYARLDPTPVAAPRLVKLNVELARELGLDPDALASARGVEILAGNRVAEGSEPLAHRLCRAPVRAFCAAARRRPRQPAGRGVGA